MPAAARRASLGGARRPAADALEPIAVTEAIAYDFLAKGGKYSRPFITLAVYDAMTRGHGTGPAGAQHILQLPDAIFRAAMSIETFHKARWSTTISKMTTRFATARRHCIATMGRPPPSNIGDYLIGMGYRLV